MKKVGLTRSVFLTNRKSQENQGLEDFWVSETDRLFHEKMLVKSKKCGILKTETAEMLLLYLTYEELRQYFQFFC